MDNQSVDLYCKTGPSEVYKNMDWVNLHPKGLKKELKWQMENSPCVEIAKRLGYGVDIINTAMQPVHRNKSQKLNAGILLDEIFKIEKAEDTQSEDLSAFASAQSSHEVTQQDMALGAESFPDVPPQDVPASASIDTTGLHPLHEAERGVKAIAPILNSNILLDETFKVGESLEAQSSHELTPQYMPLGAQSFPDVPPQDVRGVKAIGMFHTNITHDYTQVWNRLNSFNGKWFSNAVCPVDLARAGFYWIGPSDDRVQCPYCRGKLYAWNPTDIPMEKHRKHFPKCEFVLQTSLSEANRNMDWVSLHAEGLKNKLKWQMENSPCVEIVKGLGYGVKIIKTALQSVYRNQPHRLTAVILLDEIFKIEESQDTQSSLNVPPEDVPASASVDTTGLHLLHQAMRGIKAIGKDLCNVGLENEVKALEYHRLFLIESRSRLEQKHRRDVKQLQDSNDEYVRKTQCKVCLVQEVKELFLPCSHIVCCESCTPKLKHCPVCRQSIRCHIPVYLGQY